MAQQVVENQPNKIKRDAAPTRVIPADARIAQYLKNEKIAEDVEDLVVDDRVLKRRQAISGRVNQLAGVPKDQRFDTALTRFSKELRDSGNAEAADLADRAREAGTSFLALKPPPGKRSSRRVIGVEYRTFLDLQKQIAHKHGYFIASPGRDYLAGKIVAPIERSIRFTRDGKKFVLHGIAGENKGWSGKTLSSGLAVLNLTRSKRGQLAATLHQTATVAVNEFAHVFLIEALGFPMRDVEKKVVKAAPAPPASMNEVVRAELAEFKFIDQRQIHELVSDAWSLTVLPRDIGRILSFGLDTEARELSNGGTKPGYAFTQKMALAAVRSYDLNHGEVLGLSERLEELRKHPAAAKLTELEMKRKMLLKESVALTKSDNKELARLHKEIASVDAQIKPVEDEWRKAVAVQAQRITMKLGRKGLADVQSVYNYYAMKFIESIGEASEKKNG